MTTKSEKYQSNAEQSTTGNVVIEKLSEGLELVKDKMGFKHEKGH